MLIEILEAGLEPAISSLGGRRLIHQATRADNDRNSTINECDPMSTCLRSHMNMIRLYMKKTTLAADASLAQLAEYALRKRTVVGSIPTGGFSVLMERSLVLMILQK